MVQWDAFLPYIAPNSRQDERRSSNREPAGGSPRSCSPSSGSDTDALPNIEDIYDLSTSQLAELEADLGSRTKGKSVVTEKEEKLHKLIRLELSERRSVEEIGLALVGGRFDLSQVPLPKASQQPGDDASSALAKAIEQAAGFAYKPDARQSPSSERPRTPAQPAVLPPSGASPRHLSSRNVRQEVQHHLGAESSTPGWGSSVSSTSSPHQAGKIHGVAKDFKPTPVQFDFVIGKSSVKKPRPKPKKKPVVEDKGKGKGCVTKQPRPPIATQARSSTTGKAPKPTVRRGDQDCHSPHHGALAKGHCIGTQVDSASGHHSRGSRTPTPSTGAPARSLSASVVDEEEESASMNGDGAQVANHEEVLAELKESEPTECEDPLAARSHSERLAEGEVENSPRSIPAEAVDAAESIAGDEDPSKMDSTVNNQEADPRASDADSTCYEAQDGGLEATEAESMQDNLDEVPEDATAQEEVLEDVKQDSADECSTDAAQDPVEAERHASGTLEAPVDREAEELIENYQNHQEAVAELCEGHENIAEASPCEDSKGSVDKSLINDGRAAEESEKRPTGGRKQPAPRRPPLPHDALKPQPRPAATTELDLVGLDAKLLTEGKIQSYAEQFPSLISLFTWGHSQADKEEHRERNLREALQLFTQFCEVIGSLESQFNTNLAPFENSTPSATKQALTAMGTRGAGLYGVFLRGVIDKMSEDGVSCPLPPSPAEPREVCALRYYKVVQNRTEVYDIVTRVFHKKVGWEELPHGFGLSNVWNLCWTWSKPKLDYSRLCVWQKVNHFPENKHLTRKDCLKRCLDRYTRTGAKVSQYFHICPRTFVLPKEYCNFIECFQKIEEENDEEGQKGNPPSDNMPKPPKKDKVPNLWIMKPAGSSRGRGIQVVNDVGSVHYGELTIIQQYLPNPFLINGYKWDMRTYVTVTSFNPLEAFIYKDGFARFTTVPYSTRAEDLDNKLVHLTNSSIQRHNEESMLQGDHAEPGTDERYRDALVGGTKISFATLRDRLAALGVSWDMVWAKMIEVVLKSLCMVEDQIPHQVNSFELFGYDLLLDSDLRVWLIEVNASPSMGQEHLLDEQVKQPLISDTIDLISPMSFDRRKLAHVLHRRVEKKGGSGAAGGRRQLDIDVHAIFDGQVPRQFGEMPKHMGNYDRIAPSEQCDNVMRARSMLFNR
mmetsp:Transcript_33418/g.76354  ORF Transcript_33418/g.76354 Transcript_33418/m.76354 type:complete len:1177 (+) Transcript_33418:33-3563(+)